MNDDELMTAVRDSFADVRSVTELDRIVSRSQVVRARRGVAGVVAAVGATAAAGVAVAVSVAMPASPPAASPPAHDPLAASHPAIAPSVRLAAWTVARQTDGNIKVTFREAADAAGLQRTLRTDGVPASVTFTGHQNPACHAYTSGGGPAFWPFGASTGPLSGRRFIHDPKSAYTTPYALVIDPSALPSGAGLGISASGTPGAADNFQLNVILVRASPQCTGS
jgi:hypothetical protein